MDVIQEDIEWDAHYRMQNFVIITPPSHEGWGLAIFSQSVSQEALPPYNC